MGERWGNKRNGGKIVDVMKNELKYMKENQIIFYVTRLSFHCVLQSYFRPK